MRRHPIFAILLISILAVGILSVAPVSAASPDYPGDPTNIYSPLMLGDTDASKGGMVSVWQTALGMNPTGTFNVETQWRTRQWQSVNGMLATGWVGYLSWVAMFGQSATPSTVLFTGAGWGHGVGLSQYGALGMAAEGNSATQIIEHFYSGATPTSITDTLGAGHWLLQEPKPIWVNVVSGLITSVYLNADPANTATLVVCQNGFTGMSPLSSGADSPFVLGLEHRLAELKDASGNRFFLGTPDTVFDAETDTAVRNFQAAKGLTADGQVGAATRAALLDEAGENCLLRTELAPGQGVTFTRVATYPFSSASDNDNIDRNVCSVSSAPVNGGCRASVRVLVPASEGNPATTAPLTPQTRIEVGADARGPNSYGEYARGFLRLRPDGYGKFHVVAQLGVDEYMYGISEVFNSWPAAAQQAQAIAARSYGVATVKDLGPHYSLPLADLRSCWCHVVDHTDDQVYTGWAKEGSAPNWVAAANATAGLVVRYPPTGALVKTFYSSSTGGRSQNSQDRWGGVFPYLVSVDDIWSLTPKRSVGDSNPVANPYAIWIYSKTPTEVRSILDNYFNEQKLPRMEELGSISVIDRYDSGAVKTVKVTGLTPNGSYQEWTVGGTTITNLMKLRGRYFDVYWPAPEVGSVVPIEGEKPVLQDPTTGIWTTRSAFEQKTFYFGNPGDTPFTGDWDCDGVETPGLYRRSNGYVYLRNSNTQGNADIKFFFGNPGDIPIAGDFNGNGCDTVSIYRPSQGRFYIINQLGSNDGGLGAAEYSFLFGNVGDVPFAGDWNGDGIDTPGLRRSSNGFVYLRYTNTQGNADISYFYGNPGDLVFVGDFDEDGIDTVALYRPSTGIVYVRNSHSTGAADWWVRMGGSKHVPAGIFPG